MRKSTDYLSLFLAAAAGALIMYFLDPDRGNRRRHITRDRVTSNIRGGGEKATKLGKYAAGHLYGAGQQVSHLLTKDAPPVDDKTLSDRVETVLFRDPDFPKGRIVIDTIDGIVELRGELDTLEQIQAVENQVREIAGVKDVNNFLHLPHTPAPNKEAALEASEQAEAVEKQL